jgi:hypothetical protein
MVLPYWGAGIAPTLDLHKPQRAPFPNKKFRMPLQPLLSDTSVTTTTIEKTRLFIFISLICIASLFGNLECETEQNYVVVGDVQTQRRFFSATMC